MDQPISIQGLIKQFIVKLGYRLSSWQPVVNAGRDHLGEGSKENDYSFEPIQMNSNADGEELGWGDSRKTIPTLGADPNERKKNCGKGLQGGKEMHVETLTLWNGIGAGPMINEMGYELSVYGKSLERDVGLKTFLCTGCGRAI